MRQKSTEANQMGQSKISYFLDELASTIPVVTPYHIILKGKIVKIVKQSEVINETAIWR